MIHRHTPLADGSALIERVGIAPDLVAGSRVHGPHVINRGEIDDAIHQQWRGFDAGRLICLKCPCEAELMNVLRSNLRQRAMPSSGVVAVVTRPAICRGV